VLTVRRDAAGVGHSKQIMIIRSNFLLAVPESSSRLVELFELFQWYIRQCAFLGCLTCRGQGLDKSVKAVIHTPLCCLVLGACFCFAAVTKTLHTKPAAVEELELFPPFLSLSPSPFPYRRMTV